MRPVPLGEGGLPLPVGGIALGEGAPRLGRRLDHGALRLLDPGKRPGVHRPYRVEEFGDPVRQVLRGFHDGAADGAEGGERHVQAGGHFGGAPLGIHLPARLPAGPTRVVAVLAWSTPP